MNLIEFLLKFFLVGKILLKVLAKCVLSSLSREKNHYSMISLYKCYYEGDQVKAD